MEYQELIADGPAQPPAGTCTSPYDRPNVLRNIDIYLFETSQAQFTVGDMSTLWWGAGRGRVISLSINDYFTRIMKMRF